MRKFEIDRAEGKLLGVCAGIANATGIDATIVRVALVVATLAGGWPWTVVAYAVLALIGHRSSGAGAPRLTGRLERERAAERMRNLDLRMQAIETCVTSSNSRLAREIEELR